MPPNKPAPPPGVGTTVIGDSTGALSISLLCPWCGVASTTNNNGTHFDNQYVYLLAVCQQRETCGRASLAVITHNNASAAMRGMFPLQGKAKYSATVHPTRQANYAPEGVDASVARDFEEALRCREAGFLYASALVARRVLQVTARSIVGQKANLKEEIDALPADRVSQALKDAAHEVRFLGNTAAHAGTVAADEVDELLAFTDAYLDALFVLPAKVARVKASRTGTAAPTGSTPP